jgi:tRNA 2-thiouridine synthesizing protein E
MQSDRCNPGTISVDREGFLQNLSDWSEQVAVEIALTENIQLTSDHLEVIHLIRKFYNRYKIQPTTRVLVKRMGVELGKEKGNSIYLMSLFPRTPLKIVSKIAGLPKPPNCD